ncbi:hypothetical protein HK096_002583, partial [Nowakowskiella sp. JEL0078]
TRKFLRLAMKKEKSDNQQEKLQAAEHYLQAILQCLKEGKNESDDEVTGIMYKLGDLYFSVGNNNEAISIYERAFLPYGNPQTFEKLDGKTKLRAIGVAHKLGELYANNMDLSNAQYYFEWATKVLMESAQNIPPKISNGPLRPLDSIKPPEWATNQDLAITFEALARIYQRQEKPHMALVVYLRALQIVEKETGGWSLFGPSKTDQIWCRRAIISNNVADCLVNQGKLNEALSWAKRANEFAKKPKDQLLCAECENSTIFNIGTILEMKSEFNEAIQNYNQVIDSSTVSYEQAQLARQKLANLVEKKSKNAEKK